ncbi:MAG: hypothetical protein WBP29_03140 [Candidatus Zixiibacteriota bacterium]
MRNLLIAILATLLLCASALAVYPQAKVIDDGALAFFILNTGSFGIDFETTRNGFAGLYYPRDSFRGLMGGGGIWVAGKKDGEWRLTISGDDSEFSPGPIGSNGLPADTTFRPYKITRGENYLVSDDYRNWPASDGAPVDALGRPLIKGSQVLYTMFNDADSSQHVFDGFAGTLPLDVEVKLFAHTWDNDYQLFDTMLAQVVIMDYTITNRGDGPIDSCIVSTYVDPDIGFNRNDRIGSRADLQCAYVYDEADFDSEYGKFPPVVGMTFLTTLAASMNYYYPCSFLFPECVRVDTLTEVLNLIRGLRPNGQPYFNPITTFPTTFPFDGDPEAGAGWINELSRDYRFLLNTLPVNLEPGDSIVLRAALVVAQGTSTKNGVSRFLETVQMLRSLQQNETLNPVVKISGESAVVVRGTRALGRDWGGRFLGGGIDVVERYLPDLDVPSTQPDAELAFGTAGDTRVRRFVHDGSMLKYAGDAAGPTGIALTIAGARRECFYIDVEDDGTLSNSEGKLDPLILTDIEYGANFGAGGTTLASLAQHLLYAVNLDQPLGELSGTSISLDGTQMNADLTELADVIEISEPSSEAPSSLTLEFTNLTDFVQTINLTSSRVQSISFSTSSFDLGVGASQYVTLYSTTPFDPSAQVEILIDLYGFLEEHLMLPLVITPATLSVSGDADNDGVFDLIDLLHMVRILYRDDPIVTPLRQIDADCNQRFNLIDLMSFVNFLYERTPLPCQSQ